METPSTGMGCTLQIGSDSYPYTVTQILNNGDVRVQEDKATPGDGHDYYGKQVWVFERNKFGAVKFFRYDAKQGRWREVIEKAATGRRVFVKPGAYRLLMGERNKFSDPSF